MKKGKKDNQSKEELTNNSPQEETEEPSSYEDKYSIIDEELAKRRSSWFLTSIAWIDYDDVCQIIRTHLFRKWSQWDQERPLRPWLNKIISNQLKNILRNYYANFARPCLSCPFNLDEESCGFTESGMQDTSCPLFRKWSQTKKNAYDVKVALPLEGKDFLIEYTDSNIFFDFEKATERISVLLRERLSKKQFELFNLLFIKNIDETEVANIMGYKSSESGRKAGYKQIKNTKKLIKKIVTQIIKEQDLF